MKRRRRRFDEPECTCERFCCPPGEYDANGQYVQQPCPHGIERTHYLVDHPDFVHNEDAHSWGLTDGQRAALRGKHTNAKAASKYAAATYRILGWRPCEPMAASSKAWPHGNCDCSAVCRAYTPAVARPGAFPIARVA